MDFILPFADALDVEGGDFLVSCGPDCLMNNGEHAFSRLWGSMESDAVYNYIWRCLLFGLL